MIYEFKASDGSTCDRDFPIGKAPSFVRRGGKRFQRVYSAPQVKVHQTPHFVSDSLPRAVKQADGSWKSPYSSDVEPSTGKPRFKHHREVENALAWSSHNQSETVLGYE